VYPEAGAVEKSTAMGNVLRARMRRNRAFREDGYWISLIQKMGVFQRV
jgi:hypothetical protein